MFPVTKWNTQSRKSSGYSRSASLMPWRRSVARRLVARGVRVHHLLADAGVEAHGETESRLLMRTRTEPPPLFATAEDRRAALERAYEIRGRAISWSRPTAPGPPSGR